MILNILKAKEKEVNALIKKEQPRNLEELENLINNHLGGEAFNMSIDGLDFSRIKNITLSAPSIKMFRNSSEKSLDILVYERILKFDVTNRLTHVKSKKEIQINNAKISFIPK